MRGLHANIFTEDLTLLPMKMTMAGAVWLLLCFIHGLCLVSAKQASVVLTMLCRDEDVNLRANLPNWLSVVDYFVFVVDSRTTDSSVRTIESILNSARKKFAIVTNEFVGFGAARTLSLKTAWENFPQATHVLISDPDWSPQLNTIQLRELDDSFDVFRFTMFDAERNGQHNARRMDWLLKNRHGLAMRYHLHEVLFIGPYTVKNIGWEIREVEKKGTWHSTVGHETSTSADRYKFDLQLLYKDLVMYGHDPHTHYYLGVTHGNYAAKAAPQLGLQSAEVQEHVANSIKYFELRATSMYVEELQEERWGALAELGNIYATHLQKNDLKSIYWYSTCHDFNPKHVDCALALCWLYLGLGQLNPAIAALETVLKTERAVVRMSENVLLWDCDVPLVAVDLYSKKAQVQGISAEEAMYFFLLLQMTKASRCSASKNSVTINRSVRTLLNNAIGPQPVDYFETSNNFCANPALQRHLASNRFLVHPCSALKETLKLATMCDIFSSTSLPAYEEFQIGIFERRFLGTAVLPDIIHHAHQGYASRFVPRDGAPMRFLFAEHFEPQMVYNLLGQLQRQPVDFEVVVVSPDAQVIASMQERLTVCRAKLQPETVTKVTFKQTSLLAFFSAHRSADDHSFSFIEYNSGLSKAADTVAELAALHELLRSDGGVLGATYFTQNRHTTRLRKLVDSRNVSHMVPFSLEATRLVHKYLDQHRLSAFKTDSELVVHLGGEETVSQLSLLRVSELKPRVQWRTYSQQQATNMLTDAGFQVTSWVPSAYSHPFEEIEHYEVQKFRALGMSQEMFVDELIPNFRYSMYLVKNSTDASAVGRKRLTESDFKPSTSSLVSYAASALVVDRVGYLGSSFRNMEALAQQRQSTSIEFAHHSLDTRFGFIVSPVIAPCLPHLSSRPTLQALHEMNKQFALREKREFDEVEAHVLLLSFLSYLEKLNMIAYESDPLEPVDGPNGAKKSRPFKIETIAEKMKRNEKATASSAGGSPPVKKFGGLNVKNVNTPEVPAVALKKTPQEVPKAPQEPVKITPKAPVAASRVSSGAGGGEAGRSMHAGSASASATASSSSSGLSYAEQVKRMRALGYSEELIDEMLQDEKESQVTSTIASTGDPAAVTLAAHPADQTEQGQKDPKNIIDLLTRFTQQRKAETAAATAMKESTEKPPTPSAEATSQKEGAAQKVDKPVFSFMLPDKTTTKGKSDLVMGGGLKLPSDTTVKSGASPAETTAAFKQGVFNVDKEAAGRTAAPKQGGSPKEDTAQSKLTQLKAQSIKLPVIQSESALRASVRSLDCLSSTNVATAGKQKPNCQEPKLLKRKTAHMASTSARKIEFDAAQMEYLRSQRVTRDNDGLMAELGRSYSDIASYLREFKLDDPYRVVRLNSNSALKSKTDYLNRLVHLPQESSAFDTTSLVHSGAMQYLKSLRKELLTHDFLVVDVILQEAALRSISRLLLSSTVWFDVTNGAAFAAHHDEGLVFPAVHSLVQQVALALSSEENPMVVSSFYAISMGLQHSAYSPVFMASKDDLNVVLWLNPQWPTDNEPEQSGDGSDGLRIYDEASAGKLFSQGVSLYPSAHSDFLSRSSSLAIDLHARCNVSHSEFIPRVPNRLVVVRSKKLCTLLTAGAPNRAKSFEQSTMIALVMVLTPSNGN